MAGEMGKRGVLVEASASTGCTPCSCASHGLHAVCCLVIKSHAMPTIVQTEVHLCPCMLQVTDPFKLRALETQVCQLSCMAPMFMFMRAHVSKTTKMGYVRRVPTMVEK